MMAERALVVDSRDWLQFRAEAFTAVALAATPRMRVLLVNLLSGQFLPVHAPQVDLAALVVEGEGLCVAGGHEGAVRAGTVLVAPAGAPRGFQAHTRMVLFVALSPPPTEADHAEVGRKFAEGRWR